MDDATREEIAYLRKRLKQLEPEPETFLRSQIRDPQFFAEHQKAILAAATKGRIVDDLTPKVDLEARKAAIQASRDQLKSASKPAEPTTTTADSQAAALAESRARLAQANKEIR